MFDDAYVQALNADRERLYEQRERERRQREIIAQRTADAPGEGVVSARRGMHRWSLRLAHAGR